MLDVVTLTCRNLEKSYKGRMVVRGVSLSLTSGEVVGLLGPNGAGKTTTFYMVVGLVRADNGSIALADTDITELPMYARAQFGLAYLPQEPSVFRKMTVEQNIMAVLELIPEFVGERQKQRQRIDELIEGLNLTKVRRSLALSLSGGERRRVEIARALALSPRFLLLDEPFAGIDPLVVNELQELIRTLQRSGIGILITDHNVRETLGICTRAYILSDGAVIETGNPSHIAQSETARRYYLGDDFSLG